MRRSGLTSYKGRGGKHRPLNNVILIVCVGETEKIYFDQFKLDLGEIKVKTIQDPVSPVQMVKRAISEKNKGSYAQVWCVFDKYFSFQKVKTENRGSYTKCQMGARD